MYSRSEVDIPQSFNVNTVFELDPIFICFKINRMLNTFVSPLKSTLSSKQSVLPEAISQRRFEEKLF